MFGFQIDADSVDILSSRLCLGRMSMLLLLLTKLTPIYVSVWLVIRKDNYSSIYVEKISIYWTLTNEREIPMYTHTDLRLIWAKISRT